MSLISSILSLENVVVRLDVGSKKRAFEEIGQLLENTHSIARSAVFDSLFAREKLGSTGLGEGIAIPHGRIKGLREAVGAFVKLQQPIAFDAPDNQPVLMLFVLLVPEQATDLHLQILGELAQIFSDKTMREQLAGTDDCQQLHHLITRWTPNAASQRSATV